MELKCRFCGYSWNYHGDNPYYATCPHCYYKVRVIQENMKGGKENVHEEEKGN